MLYEKLTIGKLYTENRGQLVSISALYLGGGGMD
jgi:hypothetical protein